MPNNPNLVIGWSIRHHALSPGLRPTIWYIYLHTQTHQYRIDGLLHTNATSARTWAKQHHPELPEITDKEP